MDMKRSRNHPRAWPDRLSVGQPRALQGLDVRVVVRTRIRAIGSVAHLQVTANHFRVHPIRPHVHTSLTEGARQRITADSSGSRPFPGPETFVGN